MCSLFNEIQQRAEKLNTDVRLGAASEFRIPSITSPTNGTSSSSGSSLLDANLDDIFRRSEEIWNKKQSLRAVTGMGASLRANKDLNQLSTSRFVSQQPQKPMDPEKPIEYEGISKSMEVGNFPNDEAEKYVERAFERARIAAERLFLNQPEDPKLQSAKAKLFSPKRPQQDVQKMDKILGKGMKHLMHLPNSPLSALEQNVFAQKVDDSLSMDCKAPIGKAIQEAVKKLNTREADYIWKKVFTMFPKTALVKIDENVREMRSSKNWLDHIIEMGTQYLQKELEEHMESTIEANRVKARRGGIPGTHSRVEAYLNVKTQMHLDYEDGKFGSHPKWTVLFYCLRIGDPNAASKVAKELQNNAQCSTLVGILANLTKNTTIDDERRIKLRAEWKQNAQGCQDVYKKAVYGLFLGFDCPEANQTIEDWLWARMVACKYSQEPNRALRQLQATICAQHGEKYFVGEGGSHLLYFAVLLLTGQLERAIHVLFKSTEHRVHSIHIALLANQLRLLLCTQKCSDEILVSDVHEASICYLNFARLMLLYVKDFELSNVNYALNYAFFLRHFELDPMTESRVSRSVFEAFVSRMVFLSGERDSILGQLNARGERVPGLIDKFSGALNISDVIGRVAFDTNVQGDALGAAHLYALANRLEDATKLICCQLSQCISNPTDPPTQKAVECAQWLAARCQQQMPNASNENAQFATLVYLLDLHTFFGLASEGKHKQAVEALQKLRLIPTDPEDVQSSVAQFHSVPEEVRPLLPNICAQLMRSIVALHQESPVGSPATVMLKQFAKALILFTAMIPYRFPVSINSLLLQLQSKII